MNNTRFESHIKTDRQTRYKMILAALTKPMTARQLSYRLGFTDLNAVKPRLTEMAELKLVEQVGRHYDQMTNRTVILWGRTNVQV